MDDDMAQEAPAARYLFANKAEHDWYAAQYWAMKRKREGGQEPLRTNQHILYLLLTVFTAGLFLPVWIILTIRGNHVPPDPTAPMPVWPPPGHSAAGGDQA